MYILKPKDLISTTALIAALNSRVIRWYVQKTITSYKKLYPQLTQDELLALPVPPGSKALKNLVLNIESLAKEAFLGLRPDSKRELRKELAKMEKIVQDGLDIQLHLPEEDYSLF